MNLIIIVAWLCRLEKNVDLHKISFESKMYACMLSNNMCIGIGNMFARTTTQITMHLTNRQKKIGKVLFSNNIYVNVLNAITITCQERHNQFDRTILFHSMIIVVPLVECGAANKTKLRRRIFLANVIGI